MAKTTVHTTIRKDRIKRVILAFLVAPLVPGIVLFCIGFLFPLFFFVGTFAIALAYATALTGGIFLYFLSRHKTHLQTKGDYVNLAAMVGFIAALIFFLIDGEISISGLMGASFFGLITAIYGACSGYIFWSIRRPDLYPLMEASPHA